eukprot:TRINITY_DN35442_c0_g1_i1.p1 TRINITY_DN35442_c0_g1~~TRINITY_DN35442_c0_g1_i1.p1  ORF type:complete len:1416 (+),score=502.24 TRINITY_DN35442_c0_g1_i1:368-4249(+)
MAFVSPASYFDEITLPNPGGVFLSVFDALEVLSRCPAIKASDPRMPAHAPQTPSSKAGEEKGPAYARVKQKLAVRAKVLPYFDALRSHSSVVRRQATAAILKAAFTEDDVADGKLSELAEYTIERLVKGTGGTPEARVGYGEALATVLATVPGVDTAHVLDLIDKHLSAPPVSTFQHSEARFLAWGVLISAAAIAASGRKLGRTDAVLLCAKLCDIFKPLLGGRELNCEVLLRMCSVLRPAIVEKHLWPHLERAILPPGKGKDRWTPEAVRIMFWVRSVAAGSQWNPDRDGTMAAAIKASPAEAEESKALAAVLLQAEEAHVIRWHPRIHSVWSEWWKWIRIGDDAARSGPGIPTRLFAFWDAVVVGQLSTSSADKRRRHLAEWCVEQAADLLSVSSGQLRDRNTVAARLFKTHPSVTHKLAVRVNKQDTGSVDASDIARLEAQFAELDSKQLKEATDAAAAADGDEEDDDDEMDGLADVRTPQREGHARFAHNMRRVLLMEMRRAALSESALKEDGAGAFTRATSFFHRHAFFSVPSGAIASDGLLTDEDMPPNLRQMALDFFFSCVGTAAAQVSATKGTDAGARAAVAGKALSHVLKVHSKMETQGAAGIETLYPTDEVQPVLKEIRKYIDGSKKLEVPKQGSLKIADANLSHLQRLLVLLHFAVVLEAPELGSSPEELEGIGNAAEGIGKAFASRSCDAVRLLDDVQAVSLRTFAARAKHAGALLCRAANLVVEHCAAAGLKGDEALGVLLAPLDDGGFDDAGEQDDGPADPVMDAGERMDEDDDEVDDLEEEGEEDEEDEEDDDDGVDEDLLHAKDPRGRRQTALERLQREREVAQLQARGVQMIQAVVRKVRAESALMPKIAVVMLQRAEGALRVPKKRKRDQGRRAWGTGDMSRLQVSAPVFAGCCSVLDQLWGSTGPAKAADLTAEDPAVLSTVTEAAAACAALVSRRKEKLDTREGMHLKLCAVRTLLWLASWAHKLDPRKAPAAFCEPFKKVFGFAGLTPVLAGPIGAAFERRPAIVAEFALPALTAAVAEAKKSRPYHRALLLDTATGIVRQWKKLAQLRQDARALHDSAIGQLCEAGSLCCPPEDSASDEEHTDYYVRGQDVARACLALLTKLYDYWKHAEGEIKPGKPFPTREALAGALKSVVERMVTRAPFIGVPTLPYLRKLWDEVHPSCDQALLRQKPRKPLDQAAGEKKKKKRGGKKLRERRHRSPAVLLTNAGKEKASHAKQAARIVREAKQATKEALQKSKDTQKAQKQAAKRRKDAGAAATAEGVRPKRRRKVE